MHSVHTSGTSLIKEVTRDKRGYAVENYCQVMGEYGRATPFTLGKFSDECTDPS